MIAALALPAAFAGLFALRARIGRGPLAACLASVLTLAPALVIFDFYFQLYAFVQDHSQYLAAPTRLGLTRGARLAIARLLVLASVVAAGTRSTGFRTHESL